MGAAVSDMECDYKEVEWNGEIDLSAYHVEFEFGDDERFALAVEVTGPCPRCGHTSTDGHPLFRFDGFGPSTRDSAAYTRFLSEIDEMLHAGELDPVIEHRADLLCKCDKPHKGQEKLGAGCGASWSLTTKVRK